MAALLKKTKPGFERWQTCDVPGFLHGFIQGDVSPSIAVMR
jgi:hypothetical protein